MYTIVRKVLFLFPAEGVHYFSMNVLKLLCKVRFVKKWLTILFNRPDTKYQKQVFGLDFRNCIGLAAGFDKNAKYLTELECLGFGFVEVGTVTPLPQSGNDKPRLFRLPKDKALINRMGFNNDGVKAVADRLKAWKEQEPGFGRAGVPTFDAHFPTNTTRARASPAPTSNSRLPTPGSSLPAPGSRLVIGGNIGKNKLTPNEEAWKDYEICFKELFEYVDYFVVNVSSPNTPGLRELQEKDSLKKILSHLQTINSVQTKAKPILLKIAPDLSREQLDDVIALAVEINLDGLVAANTTISRTGLQTPDMILQAIGSGGLSGKPLQQKAAEIVEYIQQKSNGRIPVIASGGIFTGTDALNTFKAGASLIQVWTGFIYEGPSVVTNILQKLYAPDQDELYKS